MNVLPAPSGQRVHVWYAACSTHQDVDVLSAAERARADAIAHPGARTQFVAGRAVARRVLAASLGMPAREVPLEIAATGKPFVAGHACHFNISHSGDRVAVAVAERALGLDIEQIDARLGTPDMVARFFADEEIDALRMMPPASAAWTSAFFGCWARKEAVLKALGDGLTRPLRSFAVTVPPSPPRLRAGDPELFRPSDWSLIDLCPGDGYAGAVAMRAPDVVVIEREWPPVPPEEFTS